MRLLLIIRGSFKPYYNWNTFNTIMCIKKIITPISFKPYYNWNTFNTILVQNATAIGFGVLNLIITGIPSILK